MEQLGVPLYIVVRDLGPALVVAVAGLWVLAIRRPPWRGLVVAALALYVTAAALPYLWLLAQSWLGVGGETWMALVMTFLQPGVAASGWFLLFAVVVFALPRARAAATPSRCQEAGEKPPRAAVARAADQESR